MGITIRNNISGINAYNTLSNTSRKQQRSLETIASGSKINRAADDASGLAISEKMKLQIKALDTVSDNCADEINLLQTAEGYLSETNEMITRMTELSEKAANGVLDYNDRKTLQKEMDQICGELDRIASTASFNGHKLFDGQYGGGGNVRLFSDPLNKQILYYGPVKNEFAGGVLRDTEGLTPGTYPIQLPVRQGPNRELFMDIPNNEGTITTVQLRPRDGDKIFLKSGETTGKTAMNVTFTTDAENKDRLLTYSAERNSWFDHDGISFFATNTFMAPSPKITITNQLKLNIGETSTSADSLEIELNSLHTDRLFKDLNNFINRTNDLTDTESDSILKTKLNNENSTYKNAYSIDITDQNSASAASDALRHVSNYISGERGKIGAYQNRIEHTVNTLTTASENTSAANSRIRDTDMAKGMMTYTSVNVIAQAAQSMLAQANSQPQNVLSLLQ